MSLGAKKVNQHKRNLAYCEVFRLGGGQRTPPLSGTSGRHYFPLPGVVVSPTPQQRYVHCLGLDVTLVLFIPSSIKSIFTSGARGILLD